MELRACPNCLELWNLKVAAMDKVTFGQCDCCHKESPHLYLVEEGLCDCGFPEADQVKCPRCGTT